MSADKLPTDTDGNESFGLTDEEYEFLQDDINQAIADGNKKYGYGGYGYIDEDGNHYPFPDNDKPKRLSSTPKSRPKTKRPSVEEIAIARGLLHVIKPKPKSKATRRGNKMHKWDADDRSKHNDLGKYFQSLTRMQKELIKGIVKKPIHELLTLDEKGFLKQLHDSLTIKEIGKLSNKQPKYRQKLVDEVIAVWCLHKQILEQDKKDQLSPDISGRIKQGVNK